MFVDHVIKSFLRKKISHFEQLLLCFTIAEAHFCGQGPIHKKCEDYLPQKFGAIR